MELVPPQVGKHLVALWSCALVSGCVGTLPLACGDKGPPKGAVCQVVMTWNKEVVFTPDPVHDGTPTPGLVGRVYLFGSQVDYPLEGDGSLRVQLFDEGQKAGAKAPVLLEEWHLDKDTLKRLFRKDTIGWGYTVFLPWGTYKPELTRVLLKLRYEPPQGLPLYADDTPIVLAAPGATEFQKVNHPSPRRPQR